jgi:hypothetical protein
LLRTWDWRTGQLLGKYAGHQNDTFVLMVHPLHKVFRGGGFEVENLAFFYF